MAPVNAQPLPHLALAVCLRARLGRAMIHLGSLAISTLRISMPYATGALGGTFSERCGVVNIALEGLMLTGAFVFVWVSWLIQLHLGESHAAMVSWLAPTAGLLCAIIAGFLLSAVHAVACVTFKVDQIISGLAINIFALGATNFMLKDVFNSASNSEPCPTFGNWDLFTPGTPLAAINPLLHPLVGLTILVFILAHFVLYRTVFGLRLRSVGENPEAANSLGINVSRYRYAGVLIGGMIASLGGVWLAADQGRFVTSMTNGRGYIALAAMIIGNWKPAGAAAACLLFGFAEALQNQLQIFQQSTRNLAPDALDWFDRIALAVPTQAIQALPYVLTIVVIAGFFGRSRPPAAIGKAYGTEPA